MDSETPRDPYLVKSVVHASRLLSAFRGSGEALPLREIAARSALPKSMAFRLLYTLERCGMVEKVGQNLYRSYLRPFKQKLYRLGYAAQGTDYQFSKEISSGLQRASQAEGIELISLDNRYSAKIAQRNADVLVREKVDLVIEFQTDEHVAPIVAAKYREANIPLIAVEIPHPGATYFGANNYEAGLIGGRYLGRWAKAQWQAHVDEIVLITLDRAGSLPRMRLTGMLFGMRETCPALENTLVTYLEGDGKMADTFEAMRRHLRYQQGATDPGWRHQRPQRPGRAAGLSGSRQRLALRHHGPERLTGRPRRAAAAGHTADRIGGLLSREVRAGNHLGGAGDPAPPAGAAGRVREASAVDAGKRQPRLSERRADPVARQRAVLIDPRLKLL